MTCQQFPQKKSKIFTKRVSHENQTIFIYVTTFITLQLNEFKTIDEHAAKASDRNDYTDTKMIMERSYQNYYAIASDLLKSLALDFKPRRSQTKPMGFCMCDFSHGLSKAIGSSFCLEVFVVQLALGRCTFPRNLSFQINTNRTQI